MGQSVIGSACVLMGQSVIRSTSIAVSQSMIGSASVLIGQSVTGGLPAVLMGQSVTGGSAAVLMGQSVTGSEYIMVSQSITAMAVEAIAVKWFPKHLSENVAPAVAKGPDPVSGNGICKHRI